MDDLTNMSQEEADGLADEGMNYAYPDDLVTLDSPLINRCACGEPATWHYDPATMAPTSVTELTHYCAMHGPHAPHVEDAGEPEPVKYIDMQLHGDYICVVPLEVRNKIGSVWLAAEEKSPFHRVIAVGPGELYDMAEGDERFTIDPDHGPVRVRRPMNTKVGDKVLIAGYAGVDLKVDAVDYRMVRDADVVATFPEPAE